MILGDMSISDHRLRRWRRWLLRIEVRSI